MYIGKLAELTGASRNAIRLYEELGLIPIPERKGQYRIYTGKDVVIIKMIRRAQAVGFNLAELKEIAGIKAGSNRFPIELATELIAMKREKFRSDISRIMLLDQNLVVLQEELNQMFGCDCPA